jgi:hypothetical protein
VLAEHFAEDGQLVRPLGNNARHGQRPRSLRPG